MFFDRVYSRYCAPKKKKNHAAAWIIGTLALLALVPLAVRSDRKRGEWGFASLLFYVTCRRSMREAGKRELTVAIPGFTHLKSFCRQKDAALAGDIDGADLEADDDDLSDLLDTESDSDPEVVISEEQ